MIILPIMILFFVTRSSSHGSIDDKCYLFGDCLDAHQYEMDFSTAMLKYTSINESIAIQERLKTIADRLDIGDEARDAIVIAGDGDDADCGKDRRGTIHKPFYYPSYFPVYSFSAASTPSSYETHLPLNLCWPFERYSPAVELRFFHKMFKAFTIADAVHQNMLTTKCFLADIFRSIVLVAAKLNATTRSQSIRHRLNAAAINDYCSDMQRRVKIKPFNANSECYVSGDCIDIEMEEANHYVEKTNCHIIVSTMVIDDIFYIINRKLNITFTKPAHIPYTPLPVCHTSPDSTPDYKVYIEKVAIAYKQSESGRHLYQAVGYLLNVIKLQLTSLSNRLNI